MSRGLDTTFKDILIISWQLSACFVTLITQLRFQPMQPAAAPAAVGAAAPGHAQLPLHFGVDRGGSDGDVALGDRTAAGVRIESSVGL